MEPELREQIISVLQEAASYMTLATVRADGFPQATAVTFINDGLNIYFGSREHSQKAANLARNNRVSAAVTLPFSTWQQIKALSMARRAVRRVDDQNEVARLSKLLLEKSPEFAEFAGYAMTAVAFFIMTPKIITLLDYSKGIGHSTTECARLSSPRAGQKPPKECGVASQIFDGYVWWSGSRCQARPRL